MFTKIKTQKTLCFESSGLTPFLSFINHSTIGAQYLGNRQSMACFWTRKAHSLVCKQAMHSAILTTQDRSSKQAYCMLLVNPIRFSNTQLFDTLTHYSR